MVLDGSNLDGNSMNTCYGTCSSYIYNTNSGGDQTLANPENSEKLIIKVEVEGTLGGHIGSGI